MSTFTFRWFVITTGLYNKRKTTSLKHPWLNSSLTLLNWRRCMYSCGRALISGSFPHDLQSQTRVTHFFTYKKYRKSNVLNWNVLAHWWISGMQSTRTPPPPPLTPPPPPISLPSTIFFSFSCTCPEGSWWYSLGQASHLTNPGSVTCNTWISWFWGAGVVGVMTLHPHWRIQSL